MKLELSKLEYALKEYSVSAYQNVAEKMFQYMELVLERNEVINLTAITERDEFVNRHLLDSIGCFGWPEIESAREVVDIGTGAGLPGIPLALCYPNKKFLLMDSLGKRIDFINDVILKLKLNNVETIHIRAEDAGRDTNYREKFALCVTRAVAPLNVLLEYCLPLVKPQGAVYAYKTVRAKEEIQDSALALRLLGGSTDVHTREYGKNWKTDIERDSALSESPYTLNIFVIEKTSKTPLEYPRKAGTPKRVPL